MNVVRGNFGTQAEFVEYSAHLNLEDCARQENALSINALHLIVLRYRGVGKHLDPAGQKLRAAARLYKLLVESESDRIGVSYELGAEFLADIERLEQEN